MYSTIYYILDIIYKRIKLDVFMNFKTLHIILQKLIKRITNF